MSEVLIRGYKAKEQIEEIIEAAKYGSNNCMIGEGLEIIEIPPHGDLIEREPLLLEFNERADKEGWAYLDNEDIENAPIVITASEEAPSISQRKKTADVGEWVEHFGDVRCSACGADSEIFYMFDPYQLPDFCPLCGAQMMWEGSNEND